ncbi:MAG: hypothetical protein CM15mP7_1620 [Pelagibacteraceae bacterium]|nr:MAG: hypothetical protein CM15mP7_1620 [Pelagibacteraceae bacterium]
MLKILKKNCRNCSSYISNLIPGEGTTEVSIDVGENFKPDFSILAVRELERSEDGNYFTQFSLFNTEKNNDERLVGNVGFGKRYLSDDKLSFTGINLFLMLMIMETKEQVLEEKLKMRCLHLQQITT